MGDRYLSSILTAVKEYFQSYHNTCYSRSINSMWILKHSKDLLETLNSGYYQNIMALQPMIFQHSYSPYSVNIPTKKLHCCFSKKDCTIRYKCIVLGRDSSYFIKRIMPNHLPNVPIKCLQNAGKF